MNIDKHPDHDRYVIERIKNKAVPVLIYGNGSIAKYTEKKLTAHGITVAHHVLDDPFIGPDSNACLVSACDGRFSEYIIIPAFFEAFFMPQKELSQKFKNALHFYYLSETYGYEEIGYDYYLENKPGFDWLYAQLADTLSRESYQAYLSAKINKDAAFLWPHVVLPQYFPQIRVDSKLPEKDFLKLRESETLVNCGAFDGDTIRSFLKVTDGLHYKKILAIEPDRKNLDKLRVFLNKNNLENNIELFDLALSDKKSTVRFREDGNMKSHIHLDGETEIIVDTIDHIATSHEVTFINMDIEGSEFAALRGAEKTIKTHKPTLAISIYHKKDDPLLIPKYLKELVPEYSFYFRLHKPIAIDAVLYATIR